MVFTLLYTSLFGRTRTVGIVEVGHRRRPQIKGKDREGKDGFEESLGR